MTLKEVVFKVEELQTEAEKINSLQLALFEAVFRGNNAPETYEWAFCVLSDLTFSIKNGLGDLKDNAFETLKKGDA